MQVIAYQLAEYACPGPVQDTDTGSTDLYGIIHKIGDGL